MNLIDDNKAVCLRTSKRAFSKSLAVGSIFYVPVTRTKKSILEILSKMSFIICVFQNGYAWSISKPREIQKDTNGTKVLILEVLELLDPNIMYYKNETEQKKTVSILNYDSMSAELKIFLKQKDFFSYNLVDFDNSKHAKKSFNKIESYSAQKDKVDFQRTEIGLAEGISAGGFITILSSLILFLTSNNLAYFNWLSWFRLFSAFFIGLYYTVTYYREMKYVAYRKTISLSVIDYIAVGLMYFNINYLMLNSLRPFSYTLLFCSLILIDTIFVLLIIIKHKDYLEVIPAQICKYRWWLISDIFFFILFLSFALLTLVETNFGSILVVLGYLSIFIMDTFIDKCISLLKRN